MKQCKNTPIIGIDPGRRFQDILGFGAALTDSSCYLLSCLGKEERYDIMEELFGSDGLNLSVARISVGASDYSCKEYNYDNTAGDMELKDFSIEYDRSYIIPTILEARSVNPGLFLFSSPWSPPGWMKTGGSMYTLNCCNINGGLYHMQSGESRIGEAIVNAGEMLVNLHMAYSNRCALGDGAMDLDTVIMALYLTGHNGGERLIIPEPLGPGGVPYPAMYTRKSILPLSAQNR